jgi:hypothetical protein
MSAAIFSPPVTTARVGVFQLLDLGVFAIEPAAALALPPMEVGNRVDHVGTDSW